MKILAFSDLHRDMAAAQRIVAASSEADIIIGAGDFATQHKGAADTLDILRSCRVPVLIVHGNHDDPKDIRTHCNSWDKGHYLHGDAITLGGRTFFGLGGGFTTIASTVFAAAFDDIFFL